MIFKRLYKKLSRAHEIIIMSCARDNKSCARDNMLCARDNKSCAHEIINNMPCARDIMSCARHNSPPPQKKIACPKYTTYVLTKCKPIISRSVDRNFQRGVRRMASRIAHLAVGGLGYLEQNPAI